MFFWIVFVHYYTNHDSFSKKIALKLDFNDVTILYYCFSILFFCFCYSFNLYFSLSRMYSLASGTYLFHLFSVSACIPLPLAHTYFIFFLFRMYSFAQNQIRQHNMEIIKGVLYAARPPVHLFIKVWINCFFRFFQQIYLTHFQI